VGIVPVHDVLAIRFPWETSLSAFLLSVAGALAIAVERSAGLSEWCWFGALWGVIGLSSPALLILLPFFGIWWLFGAGAGRGR